MAMSESADEIASVEVRNPSSGTWIGADAVFFDVFFWHSGSLAFTLSDRNWVAVSSNSSANSGSVLCRLDLIAVL
jgi:hypothetical protein